MAYKVRQYYSAALIAIDPEEGLPKGIVWADGCIGEDAYASDGTLFWEMGEPFVSYYFNRLSSYSGFIMYGLIYRYSFDEQGRLIAIEDTERAWETGSNW